jgi:hypothetical protein
MKSCIFDAESTVDGTLSLTGDNILSFIQHQCRRCVPQCAPLVDNSRTKKVDIRST